MTLSEETKNQFINDQLRYFGFDPSEPESVENLTLDEKPHEFLLGLDKLNLNYMLMILNYKPLVAALNAFYARGENIVVKDNGGVSEYKHGKTENHLILDTRLFSGDDQTDVIGILIHELTHAFQSAPPLLHENEGISLKNYVDAYVSREGEALYYETLSRLILFPDKAFSKDMQEKADTDVVEKNINDRQDVKDIVNSYDPSKKSDYLGVFSKIMGECIGDFAEYSNIELTYDETHKIKWLLSRTDIAIDYLQAIGADPNDYQNRNMAENIIWGNHKYVYDFKTLVNLQAPNGYFGSDEGDTIEAIEGGSARGKKNGDEVLWGGPGNDTIHGSRTNKRIDLLIGGDDNDSLYGHEGINYLYGGQGYDSYYIGEGYDIIKDSDGQGCVKLLIGQDADGKDIYLDLSEARKISLNPPFVNNFVKTYASATEGGHSVFYYFYPSADNTDIGRLLIYYNGRAIAEIQDYNKKGNVLPVDPKNRSSGSGGGYLGITLSDELADDYKLSEYLDPDFVRPEYNDLGKSNVHQMDLLKGQAGRVYAYSLGDRDDYVQGGRGNDYVKLGSGNDFARTSVGNDVIYGEDGNDLIIAGPATGNAATAANDRDVVFGGAGSDLIDGGIGNDYLVGGDSINEEGGENLRGDWILGGDGNDEIHGSRERDFLNGGRGSDTIYGGGDDVILGDSDVKFTFALVSNIVPSSSSFLHTLNANGTLNSGNIGKVNGIAPYSNNWDIVIDRDNLSYNITGMNGVNHSLPNFDGNDHGDFLFGGDGNDFIAGQAGSDYIEGGDGDDIIFGDFFKTGDMSDEDVKLLDNAYGGDDTIIGGAGADLIFGGAGNDILYADFINDTQNASAEARTDKLYGGSGHDRLYAGAGNDELYGEEGDDHLISTAYGNHLLDGGSGRNSYYFDAKTMTARVSHDTIIDEDGLWNIYLDKRNLNSYNYVYEKDAAQWREESGAFTIKVVGGDVRIICQNGPGTGKTINISGGATHQAFKDLRLPEQSEKPEDKNHAPEIAGGLADQSVKAGEQLSLSVAGLFTDADGDALTYRSTLSDGSALPDWINFNASTGSFIANPPKGLEGSFSLKVWASDGKSESGGLEFNMDILPGIPVNNAPEISGTLNDQTIKAGETLQLFVSNYFIDADGDALTYRATLADGGALPDWLIFDSATGLLQGAAPSSLAGQNFYIKFWASDGKDTSAELSFNINVSSGDDYNYIIGTEADDILTGTGGKDYIKGLGGDDKLYGGAGDDILDGGAGNDYLEGGAGDDTYIFGKGYGHDIVNAYEANNPNKHDMVRLVGLNLDDVDFLMTYRGRLNFNGAVQDVHDLVIRIKDSGETMTIWHCLNSEAGVFTPQAIQSIEFGDGSRLSLDELVKTVRLQFFGTDGDDTLYGSRYDSILYGGAGNDTINGGAGDEILYGGAGDDKLYGGDGNDILDGGAGNDYLEGGAGNDIYIFGKGYGHDIVNAYEANNPNKHDMVRLVGLNLDDVDFLMNYRGRLNFNGALQDVHDLVIRIKESGETMTIWHCLNSEAGVFTPQAIQSIEFGDGSRLSLDELVSRVRLQSFGTDGDDTLYGSRYHSILNGGAGDDKLYGGSGSDILDGGAGNDYLEGGGGNDVFVFGKGYGHDIVNAYEGGNPNKHDVVRLNGLTLDDVDFLMNYRGRLNFNGAVQDVHDLVIRIKDSGETMTIWHCLNSEAGVFTPQAIQSIEFGDGSSMSLDELVSRVRLQSLGTDSDDILYGSRYDSILYGGAGNDTINGGSGNEILYGGAGDDKLYGGDGNDILDGGAGNDYLEGGAGNDTYIIRRGDGQDIINNYGGGNDLLRLIDIDPTELWFSRSGDNLEISLVGTEDKVTVGNWFNGSLGSYSIDTIQAGNWSIAEDQVAQMVQALASFGAPVGVGGSWTDEQKEALNPILSAYWRQAA